MANSIASDLAAIGRITAVPKILEVVARTTGLRFAAVARVTDTTWTACAVRDDIGFGLVPGGELELETTICNEIRQHHRPVIFGNASEHPVFREHATPKLYGLQSYVSVPIFRSNGEFFGTLCAIDPLPATLDDPLVLKTFELFAELIATQLEAEERLELSESELLAAHDVAKLREQFIAVLGHDIRSPLQAIAMGTTTLKQLPDIPARGQRVVEAMERAAERLGDLVDDVLDFARGRLGNGIPVTLDAGGNIRDALEQVVAEVQSAHPGRNIRTAFAIDRPVSCDARRVAQLFANLLVNAVENSGAGQPVNVEAIVDGDSFRLSVHNLGLPIPEHRRAGLFEPFTRATGDNKAAGLGLGLYIASEIARAHHGRLELVSSSDEGTLFAFSMPVGVVEEAHEKA